jgi:hypothetical protein
MKSFVNASRVAQRFVGLRNSGAWAFVDRSVMAAITFSSLIGDFAAAAGAFMTFSVTS